MSKVEKAVQFMLDIAKDDSHGYDQINRWGPNYDCSSLVISAYEQAGVPVKSVGGATYTGNMLKAFKKCGFIEVKIGDRKRGDVLLNVNHHTAMVVDFNTLVQASINEKGTITGGKSGDQTGREIATRSYYSYPWDYCLRYPEGDEKEVKEEVKNEPKKGDVEVTTVMIRNGSVGAAVKSLQILLNGKMYSKLEVDGEFGPKTEAVVKIYQKSKGLEVDGIVGKDTWTRLINS